MIRFAIRPFSVLAALALAGCTTFGLQTAVQLRSLDYLNDDLASMLIAFDLPDAIQPVPGASVLRFDIVAAAGEARHITSVLTLADADDLAAGLPPPAPHRTYYLFGFSDEDKAALRDAQAWARRLPPGGNRLSIGLVPGFCHLGSIDPRAVRLSALVALPGTANLAPLIENETLETALAATGGQVLPACGGSSA